MPRGKKQTETFDKLSVCVDCYLTIYSEEVVPRSQEAVDSYVSAQLEYFASRGDKGEIIFGSPADEYGPYFSWKPCDLCGSRLGGDRYDIDVVFLRTGSV